MKISPGNAQILSHLCLSHLHHHLPCKFGALEILASSPDDNAYYALPVRQASALPAASFRCNLAVVIFAVRLMVPLTGPIGRLALLSICAMPGAPNKKPAFTGSPNQAVAASLFLFIILFIRSGTFSKMEASPLL
jgi:hypothetical protein